MNAAPSESQGDSVSKPRVAEPARLPWVTGRDGFLPQRGCVPCDDRKLRNHVVVDDRLTRFSQGNAARNLGLNAAAPLGQAAPGSDTLAAEAKRL